MLVRVPDQIQRFRSGQRWSTVRVNGSKLVKRGQRFGSVPGRISGSGLMKDDADDLHASEFTFLETTSRKHVWLALRRNIQVAFSKLWKSWNRRTHGNSST
ncbi:hypothetical protein Hanom_Chr17g01581671 [Helianthus anomalus]